MKLTASQLRKIIKEEVSRVMAENIGPDADTIAAALESADLDPEALAGAMSVALNFLLQDRIPADVIRQVARNPGYWTRDVQIDTVKRALAEPNPPLAHLGSMLGLYD
jgi:hypothetical protein